MKFIDEEQRAEFIAKLKIVGAVIALGVGMLLITYSGSTPV